MLQIYIETCNVAAGKLSSEGVAALEKGGISVSILGHCG